MATATMVQTNHDVERAVIPIDSARRRGACMSLVLSSVRVIQACRRLNPTRMLVKVIKITAGALVGTLSLIAAWWALDLAMWTSVKDFREDCRSQLQSFNITSASCREALNRPLTAPPTWRGYFETATEKFPSNWQPRYSKLEDRSLLGNMTTAPTSPPPQRSQLVTWRASGSARPYREILHDELDAWLDPGRSGMRQQRNAVGMYPLKNGLALDGRHRELFFPLSETDQEIYDEAWEWATLNRDCSMWLNTTSTGAVQDIQVIHVPDQREQPDAFEYTVSLMPPEMRAEWQGGCVYPSVPDYMYTPPQTVWFEDRAWMENVGAMLGLTFVIVALAHEHFYGGFARKTRWKWQ